MRYLPNNRPFGVVPFQLETSYLAAVGTDSTTRNHVCSQDVTGRQQISREWRRHPASVFAAKVQIARNPKLSLLDRFF